MAKTHYNLLLGISMCGKQVDETKLSKNLREIDCTNCNTKLCKLAARVPRVKDKTNNMSSSLARFELTLKKCGVPSFLQYSRYDTRKLAIKLTRFALVLINE